MVSLNNRDEGDATKKLKIISWNINGIRSTKDTVKQILSSLDADIVCFQETKITRDQLDEDTTLVDGYNSYFSFSKKRSGYSGVATYCRNRVSPVAAEEGLSGLLTKKSLNDHVGAYGTIPETVDIATNQSLDTEGRAILTQHKIRLSGNDEELVTVINVYCPRADPDKPERLDFKLNFYQLLENRANAILESGSHIIIVGDINTSHKSIDHCEPCEPTKFEENPGRKWLDRFLETPGEANGARFVDTFRHFHPNQKDAFTCWCTSTSARQTNYGTRLDYAFANKKLVLSCVDSTILSEVEGSDHCPILVTLRGTPAPLVETLPSICTKYWPEFAGTQTKLSAFLKSKSHSCEFGAAAMTQRSPSKAEVNVTSGVKRKRQTTMATFIKSNAVKCAAITSSINKADNSAQGQFKSEDPNYFEGGLVEDDKQREKRSSVQAAWRSLLKGPKPAPLCKGHREPCVLKIVKKAGPTFNKQFYVCARPEGHSSNPNARCNFFQWSI